MQWQEILEKMDHSKGTSNKMIQTAMLQEIKELRKQNRIIEARLARYKESATKWHQAEAKYLRRLEKYEQM